MINNYDIDESSTNYNLEEKVAQLQEEKAMAESDKRSLQSQINSLKNTNNSLTSEVNKLKARFEELERLNESYITDLANIVLQKYDIKCADGCINHLIDSNGNDYYIPNYCINDPYFEKELSEEEKDDEETIEIFLFEVTKNINLKIRISNHRTGKELKQFT